MTTDRIPEKARASTPTPLDRVMDRIEEELARLRKKRPALEVHIERAESILVNHFALKTSKRRPQLIRVRIGLGGRPKFLVRSLNERGATYAIAPNIWSCSCPSYHRRGAACKHVLASYVLYQAAQPEVKRITCNGCSESFRRGELVEVTHEHRSEHWFPGDLLCRSCADLSGVPW